MKFHLAKFLYDMLSETTGVLFKSCRIVCFVGTAFVKRMYVEKFACASFDLHWWPFMQYHVIELGLDMKKKCLGCFLCNILIVFAIFIVILFYFACAATGNMKGIYICTEFNASCSWIFSLYVVFVVIPFLFRVLVPVTQKEY